MLDIICDVLCMQNVSEDKSAFQTYTTDNRHCPI